MQNKPVFKIIIYLFGILLTNTVYSNEFINIEAEGNLESKFKVACVPLDQIENKYTPADLYPGFIQCVKEDNMKNGARLFFLAGTYGRFDSLRVVDRTAHQATSALLYINYRKIEKETVNNFMKKLKTKILANNSEELKKMCLEIKEFGPPDYYPRYMVQHGMKALDKNNDNPLVDDFDVDEGWIAALTGYMHCKNL